MKEKTKKELAFLAENRILTAGEMRRLLELSQELDEYAEQLAEKYRPIREQREIKRVRQFIIRIHPEE